ncbi:hypothetical protein pb186bvf_014145 [Paramecium bursaria]
MLLIFAIVYQVLCSLQVLRPQIVVQEFQAQRNISFGVANFGDIPWGRRMTGELKLSQPLDACTNMSVETKAYFLFVKRGNCTFVTKVRNAQAAGYQLVIIEDNQIEETQRIHMADDGTGYTVTIPSIIIKEEDGKKLQNYLQNKTGSYLPGLDITVLIKFDVEKTEQVNVVLALSLKNRETIKLLREFKPYYDKLKSANITYELQYQFYRWPQEIYNKPLEDCLGAGRYCALDPDGKDKIANGRNVVEEQLRQLCIFSIDQNLWFEYMETFDSECTIPQGYERCSADISKKLFKTSNDKINKCVKDSYVQVNQSVSINPALNQNKILERQIELVYNSGVQGYPGAVINYQAFGGRVTAKNIFGEICNSFLKPPQECSSELDDQINIVSDSNLFTTILIIVIIVIVFFVILFYVYTKLMQREISTANSQQFL